MEQSIITAAVELMTDGHCNSDSISAEDALQSYLYGNAHEGYEAECEYVESLDTIGYVQLVQTIRQNAARQIEQMDRDFEACR